MSSVAWRSPRPWPTDPGLVLLDEPTVGQDRNTWAAVAGWIAAAARAGATVGVSTHDDDLPVDVTVRLVAGARP